MVPSAKYLIYVLLGVELGNSVNLPKAMINYQITLSELLSLMSHLLRRCATG